MCDAYTRYVFTSLLSLAAVTCDDTQMSSVIKTNWNCMRCDNVLCHFGGSDGENGGRGVL